MEPNSMYSDAHIKLFYLLDSQYTRCNSPHKGTNSQKDSTVCGSCGTLFTTTPTNEISSDKVVLQLPQTQPEPFWLFLLEMLKSIISNQKDWKPEKYVWYEVFLFMRVKTTLSAGNSVLLKANVLIAVYRILSSSNSYHILKRHQKYWRNIFCYWRW